MRKLLLIDLDGLNQVIFPDAATRLKEYSDRGWRIVGISNQGGIEKGHISLIAVLGGMRRTIDLAPQIDEIYFCADFTPPGTEVYRCGYRGDTGDWSHLRVDLQNYPDIQCGYRKPEPGMLLMAISDCIFSPSEILYVGDRPEDEQAAEAAKIPFMWDEDWKEGADSDRDIGAETLYLRLEDGDANS